MTVTRSGTNRLDQSISVPTTAAQARAAAVAAAEHFAAGAVDRDRDRRLPYAEIDELSSRGLLAISVPRQYGGPDLAPSAVADVIRILAAADPNIAQIPHSHFVYLNLVRLAAPEDLAARVFGDVVRGGRLANAQSERGGATIKDIATTLSPSGSRFLLDGEKFYATGSLFAHTLAVLARLDVAAAGFEPGEYIAFVPAGADGVQIIDDWNGLGQRTTGSGTVRFTQVVVHPADLVARAPAVGRPTGYGAYAQLLHVAIDTGIARGALDAAADFVRTRSRPWFEAGVARADEDVLTVQRFGELGVDVATAEATLAAAGSAVDRAVRDVGAADSDAASSDADGADPEHTDSDRVAAVEEASIAVAVAKAVSDRVSTAVASALFEVAGTRSAGIDLDLDRFWRNARTHTLHDPVRWKYQHIGRWVLRGEAPPIHGVI
ncbi:MAG: acyl-CoA dehydrogenase family protein [Gordonia sp. (in: high G+C Gram-positive bacteria)]